MAEFEVIVEDIVFRNDQNGFTVATVKPDGSRELAAVGIMPFLAAGERAAVVLTLPRAVQRRIILRANADMTLRAAFALPKIYFAN